MRILLGKAKNYKIVNYKYLTMLHNQITKESNTRKPSLLSSFHYMNNTLSFCLVLGDLVHTPIC